uniref:Nonstructural protein n=1 Tax=Planococcus citri densovirus TaxID=159153 RepID=A0A218L3M4_9VIRU|nr:nonstructural protein [Planococcus citri densovirus]
MSFINRFNSLFERRSSSSVMMENLKTWLQQVWNLNPQVPMSSVRHWVTLILKISELIDPETINPSDFERFTICIRKILKPWQKDLIESQMISFELYYQRTSVLLGATYQTSFPSNLLNTLFEYAKFLLMPPETIVLEESFLSGVSKEAILTWFTTAPMQEVPADAPSLTTPVSTDFFESLCVPGSASTNSEPSTGSIYCYTSRCTKGLALDKYGSTKTCKDLILQLRLYNGKKMCSDGSNQYWNFKETDCLYTMSQNSVIAGLAKQLIDEVNQHLNESGATLKKSSKRYRPY